MAYGRWKENMSHQSSNRRELVAIRLALKAFAPIIQENKIKSIQLFSDNATAVYNLNRKTAAITLYKSLLKLLSLTTMGVNIVAAHVPGIYNDHADCLSRLELAGDYQVDKHRLFALLSKWGVFLDVDLFATSSTALCKNFCAIRNIRGREGFLGNAMHINWSDMTPIIHPRYR
jgi:ribonuclease HI